MRSGMNNKAVFSFLPCAYLLTSTLVIAQTGQRSPASSLAMLGQKTNVHTSIPSTPPVRSHTPKPNGSNTNQHLSYQPLSGKKESEKQLMYYPDSIGQQGGLPLELQEHPQEKQFPTKVRIEAPCDPTHKDDSVEFQLQDTDLSVFATQIESIFGCTFISDDIIEPARSGAKSLKGQKISFKTNRPLTKQQAWDLFLTLLDLAGFNLVAQPNPQFFLIQQTEAALRAPLPTYVDTNINELPENDSLVRYIYFVKNTTLASLENVLKAFRGSSSLLIGLAEHRAFVIVDKAYNVKMLLKLVSDLDSVCEPQVVSVIQLRRADASKVAELYAALTQQPEGGRSPLVPQRKPQTSQYFPENARVIADPRTNRLIVLGTKDAVERIEQFVVKNLDVELNQQYSPLNYYRLKYADAETIANILNEITKFGKKTPIGAAGGLRGEDRFIKPMTFIPEKTTNTVVIEGDYEGYVIAKSIIEQLDAPQPQIAAEVLILAVDIEDEKSLGAQIRSKGRDFDGRSGGTDGFLGKNIKFQTSGIRTGANGGPQGILVNPDGPGVQRLLSNLLNLVTSTQAGNTILTLGKDMFGVWGIFQALQSVTNAQVISNPFLVTTNLKTALISIGETRRVISAQVSGVQTSNAFEDLDANLTVKLRPHINIDGMVILDIGVEILDFTTTQADTSATGNMRTVRKITSKATVGDQEVLALGGIIRTRARNSYTKVPLLGDIPLIGWLFKNKLQEEIRENLLILISTRIIEPESAADVKAFTDERVADYQQTVEIMRPSLAERRDPVTRLFFSAEDAATQRAGEFIFKRRRRRVKKKLKNATPSAISDDINVVTTINQGNQIAPPNSFAMTEELL